MAANRENQAMSEENLIRKRTKTYQVRKECIKRKTMELSTLCDIKACTIITSPEGELQTWPENLNDVKAVLALYTEKLKSGLKPKESSVAAAVAEEEEEEEKEDEEEDKEEEGEIDLLTLVESKLDAVNKRIRFLENKIADPKGKRKRID